MTHVTHVTRVSHDGGTLVGIEVDLWPGITVPIKRFYIPPEHRNLLVTGTQIEIIFTGEAANVNQIQSIKIGNQTIQPLY